MRMLEHKPEFKELDTLRNDVSKLVKKHEFEMLQVQMANFRSEADIKLANAEKDIDDFVDSV